jgi:hypothetical protein
LIARSTSPFIEHASSLSLRYVFPPIVLGFDGLRAATFELPPGQETPDGERKSTVDQDGSAQAREPRYELSAPEQQFSRDVHLVNRSRHGTTPCAVQ